MMQVDTGDRERSVIAHFSSSIKRNAFPKHLLYNMYEISGDKLISSSCHVIGQAIGDNVDIQNWTCESLLEIFHAVPLTVKGIDMSGLDGNILSTVISGLKHSLIKLNLGRRFTVNRSIINSIAELKYLIILNIAENTLLIDDDIDFIMSELNVLTNLDISGCVLLSDKTLCSVAKYGNSRFKSLLAAKNNRLTNIGAAEILLKCDNLECLDFSDCTNIKYLEAIVGFKDGRIVQTSRSLQSVSLNNCVDLSSESLDWVCISNPNIRQLSLAGARFLTEACLQGLLIACPTMTLLNIESCSNITGKSIRFIAQNNVHITDLNVSKINRSFSSQDMKVILQSKSRSLLRLDISGNAQLGDKMFEENDHKGKVFELSQSSILSRLLWLDVASCTSLTGYGVGCLVQQCIYLQHLNLSGLPHLTDAAVKAVTFCCKQLQHLFMNDCSSLTDRAVVSIAYESPQLLSLHLSSSNGLSYDSGGDPIRHIQFTDDALEAILDGLRSLQVLHICELPPFSTPAH